jgi:large subunit ribosomal protein L19
MRPLDTFEKQFRKKRLPKFDVGDTVDVHIKIIEGEKERVQIFTGVVLARRHQGLSETFTVRRIVQGEGVERVFPVHSPRIVKIVVKRKGRVRRAKLHYLRGRVGRATKVAEKVGAEIAPPVTEPEPEPEPAEEKPPKDAEAGAEEPSEKKTETKEKAEQGAAPK